MRLKSLKQMQDAGIVPWCKPKVMKLIDKGEFPKPRIYAQGGHRGHLWDLDEVEPAMAKIVERGPSDIHPKTREALDKSVKAQRAKREAAAQGAQA